MRLAGLGASAVVVSLGLAAAGERGEARIAGGTRALARAAGMKAGVPAQRFLEEFSRTAVYRTCSVAQQDGSDWRAEVEQHWRWAERRRQQDERVYALLGEETWLAAVGKRGQDAGGLAGLAARDARVAKAYAGLVLTGPGTAETLVRAVGLRELVEYHADTLYLYGASLAVTGAGVPAPGWPQSEPSWRALAGATPREAERFLAGLLRKDRGGLAAWFAFLHELPPEKQRFFTSSEARMAAFYRYFLRSPENREHLGRREVVQRVAADYLRSVPVSEIGEVRLPGGLSAWRGKSRGNRVEGLDEILLRLGRESVVPGAEYGQRWQRLGAVARIERQRGRLLTENEVRLLAENFTSYPGIYAYFGALRGMGEQEWKAVFAVLDRAAEMRAPTREALLGHLHPVLKLASLLSEAGAVDDGTAAKAIGRFCEELRTGKGEGAWGRATVQALRAMAGQAGIGEMVEKALGGGEGRRRDFRIVLEMQSIPPVDQAVEQLEGLEPGATGEQEAGRAVGLSVRGAVYAWHLRPGDLLASEDPGLVRKHEFLDQERFSRAEPEGVPGRFVLRSQGRGSYAAGSLANFAEVAGHAATAGAMEEDGIALRLQQMQVGLLRAAAWGKVTEEGLREAHRAAAAGRGWLERARRGQAPDSEMQEMTAGLVPPGRWARAVAAWREGRVEEGERLIGPGDVYRLGDRVLRRSGGGGAELREQLRRQLGWPGMEAGPYEGIYQRLLPEDCAKRLVELGLVLAVTAGREGIGPEELERGAEGVAAQVWKRLRMTDPHDWQSVIGSLSAVTGEQLRAAARTEAGP